MIEIHGHSDEPHAVAKGLILSESTIGPETRVPSLYRDDCEELDLIGGLSDQRDRTPFDTLHRETFEEVCTSLEEKDVLFATAFPARRTPGAVSVFL